MTYVPQHKANLMIAAAAMTSPIPAPATAGGTAALRRLAPRLRRVSRRSAGSPRRRGGSAWPPTRRAWWRSATGTASG
jgi:hypothetical protein